MCLKRRYSALTPAVEITAPTRCYSAARWRCSWAQEQHTLCLYQAWRCVNRIRKPTGAIANINRSAGSLPSAVPTD